MSIFYHNGIVKEHVRPGYSVDLCQVDDRETGMRIVQSLSAWEKTEALLEEADQMLRWAEFTDEQLEAVQAWRKKVGWTDAQGGD